MRIVWTKHAEERQREWQQKLGVTREDVEDFLKHPAQVVAGDRRVLVAQARRGSGLLRVPFVEGGGSRKKKKGTGNFSGDDAEKKPVPPI